MVITKTPLRISFLGGGTDYPVWYNQNGGEVISATINKYCYIQLRSLPQLFEHKHRIIYSKIESVNSLDEIQHPCVRNVFKYYNIKNGLELHHDSDLPAKAGLGASSSFTVGLLKALYAHQGKLIDKMELVKKAIHIEQKVIKENVGSQDQVAAGFGGLNNIEFFGDSRIEVRPITISSDRMKEFENSLCIFFTGIFRYADEIASEQIMQTPKLEDELNMMRSFVKEGISILYSDNQLEQFGKLLHKSWTYKRKLTEKITNSTIDEIYNTGIKAGATGGKLLGAGGGGFMLFFIEPGRRESFIEKMKPLIHVPFRTTSRGSDVIYYAQDKQN